MKKIEAIIKPFKLDEVKEALQEVALLNGVETVYLMTDGAPNPMAHSLNMWPVKVGVK